MALLGLSLILASFILFCMRRPAWLPSLFGGPSRPLIAAPPRETPETDDADTVTRDKPRHVAAEGANGAAAAKVPMPPPPPPVIQHTAPELDVDDDDDEQTTPKAAAATLNTPVPALALSAPEPTTRDASEKKKPNGVTTGAPSASASTLMPPPPRPPTLRPLPTAGSTTTSSSLAPPPRARNLPIPARGPGCSTLAPPPTHTSKPAKPSRAVVLEPGHSPLDWARLANSPTADLRGLAAGSPYLRVTPSMLKKMTGRKGKDAWTVLGGKVYNMSPYLPFHPGGQPELLRGAGRDGTRLFGEIHPWVNYEGMLAACLVGIFVAEEEEGSGEAGTAAGDMEAMD
ncbi:hypothetical protein C8A00DRAFT_33900 [Chaetomidium leptoderma]|uniref:Cytochrome b5 heme-binding domain-containing protein n=1 Tax=Chaetomidium leptoderma TaxID=669021 RepID=A0AAN6VKP7_9PEZI|nr:hypothetical protein C8A00DRAFT_33900 [Chaetomidium leptoderma]